MKNLNFLIFLFLLGCSETDKPKSDEPDLKPLVETDSVKSTEQAVKDLFEEDTLTVIEKPDKTTIDFPLDSLLSFDSEEELKKIFKNNVKRSIGYYPEGMGKYANTLLFPDSKNEVEFVWADDSLNFSGLQFIELSGNETDWKTKEGITLGTGIKELEKLNKKPFTFFGLGWDYSGSIDWKEGYLDERKIFGSLEYPGEGMPIKFEGLLGDHEIESSDELAQAAELILIEITMRRPE